MSLLHGLHTEITTILQDEINAWNKGDAEGFSRHFADDGTFTNILGMFGVGKGFFLERHQLMLNGIFRNTIQNQEISNIRFIPPDVAIVDTYLEVKGCPVGKFPGVYINDEGVLRTRLLQVLKKEAGGWKIVAYHNVDIKNGVPVPESVPKGK